MKISAKIESGANHQETTLQTNGAAKTIQVPVKPSGFGSSINGGELLLLSLATCFCNDIYREAAKRNIAVSGVEVEFAGEFGGEGEPGSNFTYHMRNSHEAKYFEIKDHPEHDKWVKDHPKNDGDKN